METGRTFKAHIDGLLKKTRAQVPEEVFTPRSAKVNASMYVERPQYQKELRNAIRSGQSVIVYGDSGCGKSWLYKKVFLDDNHFYATLDLNECKDEDDIDLLALELVEKGVDWILEEKSHSGTAGVMPQDIGLQGTKSGKYRRGVISPIEQLCSLMCARARPRRPILVFENMEHCLDNQNVVNKLQSLVLTLDDVESERSKVQLCFVGVPDDMKKILSDNNKYQTIANRIFEMPEVQRMTKDEARSIVHNGFVEELEVAVDSSFDYCVSQIMHVSYRIPQYIHEICLQVAYAIEDSGLYEIKPAVVADGISNWVRTNARQSREDIEKIFNHRAYGEDLRALVVYAISVLDEVNFSSSDVENQLVNDFPDFARKRRRLSASKVLNNLCKGDTRLLKVDSVSGKYRVANPKLRSVMRMSFEKDLHKGGVSLIKS